jgi:hypothetical protein
MEDSREGFVEWTSEGKSEDRILVLIEAIGESDDDELMSEGELEIIFIGASDGLSEGHVDGA